MKNGNELECGCYSKFKEQIQTEDDKKTPEIRYNEFMKKILEEDTRDL